jgi:hypothetical protein
MLYVLSIAALAGGFASHHRDRSGRPSAKMAVMNLVSPVIKAPVKADTITSIVFEVGLFARMASFHPQAMYCKKLAKCDAAP